MRTRRSNDVCWCPISASVVAMAENTDGRDGARLGGVRRGVAGLGNGGRLSLRSTPGLSSLRGAAPVRVGPAFGRRQPALELQKHVDHNLAPPRHAESQQSLTRDRKVGMLMRAPLPCWTDIAQTQRSGGQQGRAATQANLFVARNNERLVVV